jgi:hypothetical protein
MRADGGCGALREALRSCFVTERRKIVTLTARYG